MPESSDSVKPTENEAIVATDLTKWFGEGETRMTAVNRVGLVAHFGEMLFIVGPSGSGKTTMLSMISGILRPNAGKVTVKGADIWTLNNDQLADFRLNTIGFRLSRLPSVPAVDHGRECRDPIDPEAARLGRINHRGKEIP
jgi:predicted ABC-type transport system involved in lysophospholipase L1 biosynthesis ATPase subunit